MSIRRSTLLAAPAAAFALVMLSAPGAFAGNADHPPQGQTEMGPAHANSICSFSGLNDEPDSPHEEESGQTQNYGQLVAKKGLPASMMRNAGPGTSCNGHLMPWPEAFPPPAP